MPQKSDKLWLMSKCKKKNPYKEQGYIRKVSYISVWYSTSRLPREARRCWDLPTFPEHITLLNQKHITLLNLTNPTSYGCLSPWAVWYNFSLIKLVPLPSVCRCFPAASEAAIMTLLLPTLERFPLKIVQCHLNFNTGGWGRACVQPSQPSLPVVCTQNTSSSHIGRAGCGNQITAWALAVLAELFPKHALGEKEVTNLLVSN